MPVNTLTNYLRQNQMKVEIEETIVKINKLIDNSDKDFKAHEVMQLSQAALNLAHAAATLTSINNTKT